MAFNSANRRICLKNVIINIAAAADGKKRKMKSKAKGTINQIRLIHDR